MIESPIKKIIADGQGEKIDYIIAFKDVKNKYCMVYLPVGKKISVDISFMQAKQIKAWWFDPRKGKAGKPALLSKQNIMSFTSPSLGIENDWVLVIDDANTKYSEPGK